ncbi:methyltransferase [uncultured Clostridium sp.]|uniref:methyltransferase n=1 Tax=uncultured Clostridium sp. TaxID=59620 RepID=UPI0025D5593F|nr:methyltransferase [uncultured Clostridium sp.]
MNEQYYEQLLNIKTCGEQKAFNNSLHYHRYEPTSYNSLNSLIKEYPFDKNDSVIDFGCGKGRLNFYINHYFSSYVTGIEMNSYYYEICSDNLNNYLKHTKKHTDNKIQFLKCLAQEYEIKDNDNKFYFFNPFSLQIFMSVINNILDSVGDNPRKVDIILYYPSDDYIFYLENNTCFSLYKEIPVLPQYNKDYRNKFLIYRLDYFIQ